MAVLFVMGVAALLMWFAMPAHATQPECVGDRHYDGVACCPSQPEPCDECEKCDVCKPVLPCPEPPACPPVICQCDSETRTSVVYVDRCPQPEVSEVCKVKRDGTVVCPRSKKARRHGNGARRILVPQSIIDQIADVAKY